jgi:hypothetical protein
MLRDKSIELAPLFSCINNVHIRCPRPVNHLYYNNYHPLIIGRATRTPASGLIEIAAADRDARRRAVWLTEKGALSLEASLADCAAPTASSPRGSTPKPPGASRSPQRRWRRGSAKTSSRRFRPKADLQDRPAKGRDATPLRTLIAASRRAGRQGKVGRKPVLRSRRHM